MEATSLKRLTAMQRTFSINLGAPIIVPKPRFSLKFILIVMMLVCIWCAYSMNWIRQRRAAIKDGWVTPMTYPGDGRQLAPGMLWVFGETGYAAIWVVSKDDIEAKRQEAADLFPEAGRASYP